VPWTHGPGPVDPVHGTMSPVHAFFLRKINLEMWKAGALDFYKNTPELFQNFVLAPIILHLGP
jgi:hypothetical protein